MSNELCALGRAVQALQADDDATSGVSRPWGPDATAPRNTTTRGGRQNRGHPTLPDRPSATSWRGRCTPPRTARRFDHRPGTWALPMGAGATSLTPGRKLRAREHPLDLIHGRLKGARRCRLCPHPAGGRAARGACSPILCPDPVFASSVPTPTSAPRRFVLGAARCRPVTGYFRVRTNTVPWRMTVRCSIRRLVIGPGRSAR